MTNGNLTPTPRTDKNGVTVIRHMKDKLSQTFSSRLIPPVTAPAAVPERDALLSKAALAITAKLDRREEMVSLYYGVIKDIISQYSPRTLQELTKLTDDEQKAWAVHTGLMKNWTETAVNDYLNLADFFRAHNIADEMHGYLKSFPYYEDMYPQESPYPEQRREQCEAVIELVEHMGNAMFEATTYMELENHFLVPYIKDDKLRKLILTSENRQKAVRLIKQRNILDADTIAGLIDADADVPALTDGIL